MSSVVLMTNFLDVYALWHQHQFFAEIAREQSIGLEMIKKNEALIGQMN